MSGNYNLHVYPGFSWKIQEYRVPKSSLNRYLGKIYQLLQSRNVAQLQKIVEVGEISPGKARENLSWHY